MPFYTEGKLQNTGHVVKNRGQGMLLKKNRGRQLSALSLCLTVMFAPLFTAQADEPEIVPTDSSATMGAQPTSLSQPLDQLRRRPSWPALNRCRKASILDHYVSSL